MARDKSVTFERNYGLIILPVCILHKEKLVKLDMVLDTGAYLTLITPEVAFDLNITENESISKMTVSSPIGKEHGYKVKVDKFEACYQTHGNFEIGVINIHDKYKIDGLLGINFLQNYKMKISFKDNIISLLE